MKVHRGAGVSRSARVPPARRPLSRYRAPLLLAAIALLTRLPLLTISLDEVDTANFVNALTSGYDVPLLRPHPPGYPVYIFLANLLDAGLHDPLLSLSLLSALLGSLAVVPFHFLVLEFLDSRLALIGSLLFVVNPLIWTFSEAALGDVPALFFTVLLAWLCSRARASTRALLGAFVVASLAIGVRQANVAFLPLLALPLGYRWLALKQRPWALAVAGTIVFAVTAAAWLVPMVVFGSAGWADYSAAVAKQWSTAVEVYDITHVADPWLPNAVLRVQRFFYAYFLTSSWTGDDAKTPITLLLVSPWLFGFALFVVSFSFRSAKDVLVALWIGSIAFTTLTINFLPRYGLPQTPGFLLACLIGYAFLGSTFVRHPRRIELLSLIAIGCTLVLYGIKYQPPVGSFEFTPPPGSRFGGMLIGAGMGLVLWVRWSYGRARVEPAAAGQQVWSWRGGPAGGWMRPVAILLGMLVIVFGATGYSAASVAHFQKSPSHQLVEFARGRFDAGRITVCWDNVTHSSFEVLIPGVVPIGFWSVQELYRAHDAGQTLLITDKCVWFRELDTTVGLAEIGRFSGTSPLWSKAPELRLYVTGRAR